MSTEAVQPAPILSEKVLGGPAGFPYGDVDVRADAFRTTSDGMRVTTFSRTSGLEDDELSLEFPPPGDSGGGKASLVAGAVGIGGSTATC